MGLRELTGLFRTCRPAAEVRGSCRGCSTSARLRSDGDGDCHAQEQAFSRRGALSPLVLVFLLPFLTRIPQRITIEEAQALCEGQESRIATFGPEIKACEAKMKETKSSIRAHKAAVEKLAVVTREMTKEQEEREGKGERDERAEEACRWCVFSFSLGVDGD